MLHFGEEFFMLSQRCFWTVFPIPTCYCTYKQAIKDEKQRINLEWPKTVSEIALELWLLPHVNFRKLKSNIYADET